MGADGTADIGRRIRRLDGATTDVWKVCLDRAHRLAWRDWRRGWNSVSALAMEHQGGLGTDLEVMSMTGLRISDRQFHHRASPRARCGGKKGGLKIRRSVARAAA